MGRLLASKDFLAGLMYMVFGLTGLWLGRSLEVGTAAAMGAGYFPRLVCAALIAVGAALALMSLIRTGEVLERGMWRPLIFVTLSCLAFALLLRPLGLVLTLAISTVVARLAGRDIRPIPLLLLCLVLIVANVGIFVVALKIQIPLWPAPL
jgi:putative tricarboxylic transport membrane protein